MKNRIRIVQYAAAAAVFLLFILAFLLKIRHDMQDFAVNFEAGQRLRLAETLYRESDEHYQFKYLPASALLYAPLTLLPLPTAKTVWYGVILTCSALLIYLSFRLLPHPQKEWRYLWLVPPLILLKYFFREWDLGQINTVVTVMLLLMIAQLSEAARNKSPRHEILAGVLWGLGVALKPYAFLFLLYLILKQKWKAVFSGILTLSVAVLLPSLYYGFQGNLQVHKEWFTTLSKSTPVLLGTQDNISLFAFFSKWMGGSPYVLWLTGIAIACMAFLVFWIIVLGWRRPQTTFLEGAALLLCIPLVSPLGWDYTLIMGLPILMLVLAYFSFYPRIWQIVLGLNLMVVFITFYDVLGSQAYAVFMTWSVTTVNFLLILGAGFYLRLRRVC
jgi:hypothetical protein